MKIHKLRAHSSNYDGFRNRSVITTIVIHYTGNKGDTAKNNATYFHREKNLKRSAHFFVGQKGVVYKSVPMNHTAWAVADGNITNPVAVHIECCDQVGKPASAKQKKALIKLCKHIKKYCKNVKNVCRHGDLVRKSCPDYYMKHDAEWKELRKELLNAIK